jgi:cation:H+ antiporter
MLTGIDSSSRLCAEFRGNIVIYIWLSFIACLVIIAVAGSRAARYGDIIAEKTGISGLWIGLVLMATITSLPEVFNGISAVVFVKAPDLTIGDLLGSNAINLLILAFLDIFYHNRPLLTAVSSRHLLPAGLSIILVIIVSICIFISSRIYDFGIGWIGIYTPVIIILYLFIMRILFTHETKHHNEPDEDNDIPLNYGHISLRTAVIGYSISAVFVIGAGIFLAFIGEDISESTGWGQSFVGSLFIAFTTSLPEVSVSFSAMRLGAIDMAVANMIGSNLFNMAIVAIDDIFYRQGPVLATVSESHTFMGIIVLLLTGVVISGLLLRPHLRKKTRISWYVPLIIAVYLTGAIISFTLSN